MHSAFIGRTGCGKSGMMRVVAKQHEKARRGIWNWQPRLDPDWEREMKVQFSTQDGDKMLKYAKKNFNKCIVIEDAASQIGRYSKDKVWLASDSRHNGHHCLFGTQGMTLIDPAIRNNIHYVYAFVTGKRNAYSLAEEFGCEAFKACPDLPNHHYIYLNLKTGKYREGNNFDPSKVKS